MLKWFNKPLSSSTPPPPTTTPALQPKFTVPPVPHPCPHEHLALLVCNEGLLLRPHFAAGSDKGASYVRVGWGREGVQEVETEEQCDWEKSVIVYGIVGILELTFASYLLVITSRTPVGNLFQEPTHAVYSIKHVTPIPLVHDRALMAVNTLASSRSRGTDIRSSLLPSRTLDGAEWETGFESGLESETDEDQETEATGLATPTPGKVTFAPDEDIKILSPRPSRSTHLTPESELDADPSSPNSPGSGTSTPGSVDSLTTSPIAKTLADRLSFWTRLSKRTPTTPRLNANGGALPDPLDPFPPSPSEEDINASASRTSLDYMMSAEQAHVHNPIKQSSRTPAEIISGILNATAPPPLTHEERKSELEDKIVKEVVREFCKGGMYFAYTFDITRSLQSKQAQIAKSQKQNALLASLNALPDDPPSTPTPGSEQRLRSNLKRRSASERPFSPNAPMTPISVEKVEGKIDPLAEPYSTLPLWRRVDREFWWNEWLSKGFVDAGLHSYVLPIMQGHYQVTRLPIPHDPTLFSSASDQEDTVADYIVISRRSRDRAGLRYQRRGIDDEAHVANWVESESLMRVWREGSGWNYFGYVQVRGSIPLFWTQVGYGLKPPPVMAPERTHDQNLEMVRRHFERYVLKYGPHAIVNLAEQHGKEGFITNAYRDYVGELENKDLLYYEYDFHMETKGMKYENISKLVDNMARAFESQGYLWISNNRVMSEQKGVFRVNCIDCLDRTNVVQSAFARHVLNRQLGAVALLNPSEVGKTDMDVIFNDIWANNGDAISRAYAGTSALKGDFTRTGKRDLGGLLNDGVNSLARMYSSTFSDWFCQAVIDFMLGHRTLSVFSEFLLKLQSTDPRELIRLSKIRAEAIATCVQRVLPEGERLLSGWTLFSPEHFDTKMGEKFEEKVLLLTAQGLYIISYDYTLDKIKIYTRVPLGDVVSITKGAYILSPLEEASRDVSQNAGFLVSWINTNSTTRVTSYSLRNSLDSHVASRSASPTKSGFSARPFIRASGSFIRKSLDGRLAPSSSSPPNNRSSLSSSSMKGPALSRILSNAIPAGGNQTTFAAFKALPVDPTRVQRGSGSGYTEPADDLAGTTSCKEAVDLMVDAICRACEDIGNVHGDLVQHGDVVDLLEAQRMTSMYAKMEYGVKRLLWLGG